jgi:hypothetical protein
MSKGARLVIEGRFDPLVISGRDRDHDHDGRGHDHGLAGSRYRGPHGPNVPRACAILLGSGRSADDSSMLLRREAAPSVPGPTCNGDQRVPNIRPARRSLDLDAVHSSRSEPGAAGSQCISQSVLSPGRQRR